MRRRLLVPLFVWTMSAGTMAYAAFAVTAARIIDELGIGATGLGVILLVFSTSSAALSPIAGRVADAVGGTRAARLSLALAAVGYPLVALGSSVVTLAAATIPIAFAQASMNPATNSLIAAHVPAGRRGVIMGVKQSGVYVGATFVGLVVPTMALTVGWRAAFWLLGAVCAIGWLLSLVGLPPVTGRPPGVPRARIPDSARADLRTLTWYAGFMGVASSTSNFIPLYAEESLGYAPAVAGLLAAVIGVCSVATRIGSAGLAERTGRPGPILRVMAGIGVLTALVFAGAAVAPSMAWAGAITFSLGLAPWNAVAMLAVIVLVGRAAAGTGTGQVVGVFAAGLAVGPLIYGPLIDGPGFGWVWAIQGVTAGAAMVSVRRFRAEPPPVA
jgi:predicted MFS family arabinose efflux permease